MSPVAVETGNGVADEEADSLRIGSPGRCLRRLRSRGPQSRGDRLRSRQSSISEVPGAPIAKAHIRSVELAGRLPSRGQNRSQGLNGPGAGPAAAVPLGGLAEDPGGSWRGFPTRGTWPVTREADGLRETARPKSAEGAPDGDPPRQSSRARQYPRNRIRRASSILRDRAALPRSANARSQWGSNCRGSIAIQRPHRASRSECNLWSGLVRHLLLQLPAQIEKAASWSKKRPPEREPASDIDSVVVDSLKARFPQSFIVRDATRFSSRHWQSGRPLRGSSRAAVAASIP
jgi:hypothetical protein